MIFLFSTIVLGLFSRVLWLGLWLRLSMVLVFSLILSGVVVVFAVSNKVCEIREMSQKRMTDGRTYCGCYSLLKASTTPVPDGMIDLGLGNG